VHFLRLPGGAEQQAETAGHSALNPFSGPGPGVILPSLSLSPAPQPSTSHAFSGLEAVVQQPVTSPTRDGDWAMLVLALVAIAAGHLAWRSAR